MVSKVVPATLTVRHSDVPQTEQQGLLPTLAPSHSSIGLPAIQMRLDSEGFALNDLSSISLISRLGSMPNGRRDCLSFSTARCISTYVALQRSHVLPPELTSLCQRIGSGFIGAISFSWRLTFRLCRAPMITRAAETRSVRRVGHEPVVSWHARPRRVPSLPRAKRVDMDPSAHQAASGAT